MMISELYNNRYILLIELSLLVIYAVFGSLPFLALLSLIALTIIVLLAFNSPIVAVHTLMFSILIDSLIPMKNATSGPSLLVAEFILLVVVGIGALKFLFNLDKRDNIPLVILIWLPFLIWALLTGVTVAVDKIRILSYWKNYFAGFFSLSLTFYAVKNKIHLKSIIIGVIIWALLLSFLEFRILFNLGGFVVGIIGLFLKKNLLTLGWGRSNYLAAFFVIIIPVTIGYLLYTKSKKTKVFIIISLIIMASALILTLSRGGILALFLALIILLSKVLKARSFIPFLAVLIPIVAVVIFNPLSTVLFERISSLQTSGSVYSRINFYKDVWHTFLNNPVTGVGIGNLSYYSTFILAKDASPAAHNIVLGALGEVGTVGAILYFFVFGVFFREVYLSYKLEKDDSLKIFKWCFLSGLLGGLIHSLVEPIFVGLQFSIIYWILAGTYFNLNKLKSSKA